MLFGPTHTYLTLGALSLTSCMPTLSLHAAASPRNHRLSLPTCYHSRSATKSFSSFWANPHLFNSTHPASSTHTSCAPTPKPETIAHLLPHRFLLKRVRRSFSSPETPTICCTDFQPASRDHHSSKFTTLKICAIISFLSSLIFSLLLCKYHHAFRWVTAQFCFSSIFLSISAQERVFQLCSKSTTFICPCY